MDYDSEEEIIDDVSPPCRAGCGDFGLNVLDGLCFNCFISYQKIIKMSKEGYLEYRDLDSLEGAVEESSNGSEEMEDGIASPQDKALQSVFENAISLSKDLQKVGRFSRTLFTATPSKETDAGEKIKQGGISKHSFMKRRCFHCRRKVGTIRFTCHCGEIFCINHKYPEEHACKFDYKQEARKAIRRKNPVVIAQKLDKI